jgi:hypothetical protein
VACFKPFKTTLNKEKYATMINNNYIELDKITSAYWVEKSIDQSLIEKNISLGFKVGGIWQLNLGAMHEKIIPSNLYLVNNT